MSRLTDFALRIDVSSASNSRTAKKTSQYRPEGTETFFWRHIRNESFKKSAELVVIITLPIYPQRSSWYDETAIISKPFKPFWTSFGRESHDSMKDFLPLEA